jgi:hypothetical protein
MRRPLGLALVVSLGIVGAVLAAGPVDGRWRLVEQRYGEGAGNLGELDREIRLIVGGAPDGSGIGLLAGEAYPWPSWVADAGPARLEILERRLDRALGSLSVRYLVDAVAGDPLVLEVEERYVLDAAGNALEGEVRVRFRYDGEDRGGFTVHRRFEREP